MYKTINAWLRGYYLFKVNGTHFWLYHKALAYKNSITQTESASLTGRHIFKGWRTFYLRVSYSPRDPRLNLTQKS